MTAPSEVRKTTSVNLSSMTSVLLRNWTGTSPLVRQTLLRNSNRAAATSVGTVLVDVDARRTRARRQQTGAVERDHGVPDVHNFCFFFSVRRSRRLSAGIVPSFAKARSRVSAVKRSQPSRRIRAGRASLLPL